MHKRWFNVVLGAFLAAAVAVGVLSLGKPNAAKTRVTTASVQRGVVTASVSGTGNVTPGNDVALNFTTAGVVTEIDVIAGEHVTAGQVLARVDATQAQANLTNAEASLTAARSKFQDTVNNLTPQQRAQDAVALAQAQNQVAQAQQSFNDQQALIGQDTTVQQTALTQAQQAVTNAQANAAQDATTQQLAVTQAEQGVANAQANAAQDVTTQQLAVTQAQTQLSDDQASANNVSADQSAVSSDQSKLSSDQATEQSDCAAPAKPSCPADQQAVATDQQNLTAAQAKLSSDQAAANKVPQDQNTVVNAQNNQQAAALKDAQSLQSAQNALGNAQNNAAATKLKDGQSLDSAQNSVTNAQLAQESAQAANAAKEAPPLPDVVTSAEAAVTQAQSTVALDQSALNLTALTAPVAGTVAAVNGTVGQSSSSSSSSSSSGTASGFVHLSNIDAMLIKVGFTESDASEVKVGQPATIALPALPSQQLAAHVVSIDTLSTVVSNVVNYNVTLALDRTTAGVKPGMTANVTLVIGEADNVLHVPSAAVRGSGTNAVVTVVGASGQQTATPVVVGLKGDNSTQIISGLSEGQNVLIASVSASSGSGTGAGAGAGRAGGFGGLGGAGLTGGGAVRVGGG